MQWLNLLDWTVGDRGFVPRSGIQVSKKQNIFYYSSLLTDKDSVLCHDSLTIESIFKHKFLCLRREASEGIMFSGCLSVRVSGCPAVRPPVRLSGRERLPYVATFLYYANMVQQIEFIIYANIQPLLQKLFTKGQGHRSKVMVKDSKKWFLNAITWKIIIASLQFFM